MSLFSLPHFMRQSSSVPAFRWLLSPLLLLCGLCLSFSLSADEPAASNEYRVKAGFLYNFTKFVEWPAEAGVQASTDLQVCIYGVDPFGAFLTPVDGRQVKGRRLAIQQNKTI